MKRYRFEITGEVECPDDDIADGYANELRQGLTERAGVVKAELEYVRPIEKDDEES